MPSCPVHSYPTLWFTRISHALDLMPSRPVHPYLTLSLYTGTLDLMPSCPVHPYFTLSFRYLSLSLSLSLSVSFSGSRSNSLFFFFMSAFYVSYYFYRLMILFFVASFSYCMVETRSCAAGTHSSQENFHWLPDAPSTSGTPCSLNHSPRLPYHFYPNSSLAF